MRNILFFLSIITFITIRFTGRRSFISYHEYRFCFLYVLIITILLDLAVCVKQDPKKDVFSYYNFVHTNNLSFPKGLDSREIIETFFIQTLKSPQDCHEITVRNL